MSSGDFLFKFSPRDQEFLGTNCATPDTRNIHPVLDFDASTQEIAIKTDVMPSNYSGGGVTILFFSSLSSATTGKLGWDVTFENLSDGAIDIDADGWATAQTMTATTVPGTSGNILEQSMSISNGANMDGVVAGDSFRIRIRRDLTDNPAAGDAELLYAIGKET